MDRLPLDDQTERERLLQDIRALAGRITRLGFNLSAMKSLARVMSIAASQGKDAISTVDLEAAQAELAAAVRGFRRKEVANRKQIVNLRMMIGAGALVALFGGAMAQKACDPIGRAHAYLTTPVTPEGVPQDPEKLAPELTRPVSPAPAPLKSAPPAPTPAFRPATPTSSSAPSRGRTIAPKPKRPHVAKAPRVPRAPEIGGDSNIVDLTDRNFERLTSRGIWVVDFGAGWCSGCREMEPIFARVARKYHGRVNFGKMNVDVNRVRTPRYKGAIPYFSILEDGREVNGFGPTTEGRFSTTLDRLLHRIDVDVTDDPIGPLLND